MGNGVVDIKLKIYFVRFVSVMNKAHKGVFETVLIGQRLLISVKIFHNHKPIIAWACNYFQNG